MGRLASLTCLLGFTLLVGELVCADYVLEESAMDPKQMRTGNSTLEDEQCLAEQPSLTYSPDMKSVWFKVLSSTGCKYVPTIFIYNYNTSQQVSLSYCESIRNYKVDIEGFQYAKVAYFYSFPVSKNTKYTWRVESSNSLGPFTFKLRDFAANRQTNLLVVADSDISDRGMPTLSRIMGLDLSQYDALLHAGDYAYDIENENGTRGDNYFNAITKLTAQLPYLVVPGNHEWYDNIRLFNYRFKMPGSNSHFMNNAYLFKLNSILFAFVNYDLVLRTAPETFGPMMSFLDSEFAKYQNDGSVKWRVVVSHRPIYCGLYNRTDCTINLYALKPFEELYRKYNIDVRLESHEHIYERIKAFSTNMTVKPISEKPSGTPQVTSITNPTEPLAIICGLSGNIDNLPLEGYTFNVNYKDVFGVLSYLDISVTDTTFQSLLIDSISGQVLDGVIINKSTKITVDIPTSNQLVKERRLLGFSWSNPACKTDLSPILIEALLCFAVLLLLAYFQSKRSAEGALGTEQKPGSTEIQGVNSNPDTIRASILESEPPL